MVVDKHDKPVNVSEKIASHTQSTLIKLGKAETTATVAQKTKTRSVRLPARFKDFEMK